jgi:hypothetical protein
MLTSSLKSGAVFEPKLFNVRLQINTLAAH